MIKQDVITTLKCIPYFLFTYHINKPKCNTHIEVTYNLCALRMFGYTAIVDIADIDVFIYYYSTLKIAYRLRRYFSTGDYTPKFVFAEKSPTFVLKSNARIIKR